MLRQWFAFRASFSRTAVPRGAARQPNYGASLLNSPSWIAKATHQLEGAAAFLTPHTPEQPRRFPKCAPRYDGLGPRKSLDFTHNPAGQIATNTRDNNNYAWGGHYAVNGNLTSDGARTYTYDIENRLISASPGVTLSYDPLGRLFQVGSGADTTTFLYDGDALVAEYDGANAMTRRYAHSVGADVPMVEYLGAAVSDPHHLFPDHQGSVVAATGAGGAMLFRNAYDEYGIPGAANAGRFQYTGQIWIDELGMYHYKARIYSPTLGRFLQTDPIGYEGGINLYGYVGNDPVNSVDPRGNGALTVARWGYRVYRFRGNVGQATRSLFRATTSIVCLTPLTRFMASCPMSAQRRHYRCWMKSGFTKRR